MPSFDPMTEYDIEQDSIKLEEFSKYQDEFVMRPPYQRKSVGADESSKRS